jgi:hypothetical protein
MGTPYVTLRSVVGAMGSVVPATSRPADEQLATTATRPGRLAGLLRSRRSTGPRGVSAC